MSRLIIVATLVALTGCASIRPDALRVELEHVSHPMDGWPVSAANTEDGLTQINFVARRKIYGMTVDAGLGYNVQGRNGGGFYGPSLTFTGRVAYEFRLGAR